MLIKDQYHLSYCTNIHPGQDWNTTLKSLKIHVPEIKKRLSFDKPFGLGLRLSNRASEELNSGKNLLALKKWLDQQGLYVFTLNGFPYGNFHGEAVKEQVHAPDWTSKERFLYTQRLFDQLKELLPQGITGGISTSPVGYKHWYNEGEARENALKQGARYMIEIALELKKIEDETGQYLHLDIEPEPDGLLENTRDVLDFFEIHLEPVAEEVFGKQLGCNKDQAQQLFRRYLTLCYDICHFSLAYEEPEDTFERLNAAGIKIGKIQVSSALKILINEKNRGDVWEQLGQFDEPVYLHQVTEKRGEEVITYADLPQVLSSGKSFTELRAHFHVPIFLESFQNLFSTQDHILKVVDYLADKQITEHLEVETYTWEVLPASLKKDLASSIIRELSWFKEKIDSN